MRCGCCGDGAQMEDLIFCDVCGKPYCVECQREEAVLKPVYDPIDECQYMLCSSCRHPVENNSAPAALEKRHPDVGAGRCEKCSCFMQKLYSSVYCPNCG